MLTGVLAGPRTQGLLSPAAGVVSVVEDDEEPMPGSLSVGVAAWGLKTALSRKAAKAAARASHTGLPAEEAKTRKEGGKRREGVGESFNRRVIQSFLRDQLNSLSRGAGAGNPFGSLGCAPSPCKMLPQDERRVGRDKDCGVCECLGRQTLA